MRQNAPGTSVCGSTYCLWRNYEINVSGLRQTEKLCFGVIVDRERHLFSRWSSLVRQLCVKRTFILSAGSKHRAVARCFSIPFLTNGSCRSHSHLSFCSASLPLRGMVRSVGMPSRASRTMHTLHAPHFPVCPVPLAARREARKRPLLASARQGRPYLSYSPPTGAI